MEWKKFTPTELEAADYELYLYRLWHDSPLVGVTEGGLPEMVRKHLAIRGLEPRTITSRLSKFDEVEKGD